MAMTIAQLPYLYCMLRVSRRVRRVIVSASGGHLAVFRWSCRLVSRDPAGQSVRFADNFLQKQQKQRETCSKGQISSAIAEPFYG
jgi:hypothetical protein